MPHGRVHTHERQGRELFPTSGCLKAAQREHMLYREILNLDADICCLQVRALEAHDTFEWNVFMFS